MGVMMRQLVGSAFDALRYEPTAKRLRISLAGEPVADTRNGLLVWEPRRVVPAYAVPVQDLSTELRPTAPADAPVSRPILDPTVPFTAHTTPGTSFDVVVGGRALQAAAFVPDDADLAHHVVLDFSVFDWREEDERIVSHPRDPFHRIDTRRSDRHVHIECDGRLIAESSQPVLLFETLLPVRFYLPRADVAVELEPSDTVTYCAYKGRASYFSVPGGPADIAWTYRGPLLDAVPVRDRIAFFDERVDVFVDGEPQERPVTQWSD